MTDKGSKGIRPNRRQFLQGAAAAGIGFWVSGRQTWADELAIKSPNERINIAWAGIGGKGKGDVEQAGKHGKVVALCDIDDHFLDEVATRFPDVKKFNDYRQMFDKMEKDIDAVGVSTPDHTHAVIAMTALRAGKHVYCQKPMTHTVFEARQMRDAARKQKVSTQMGNQGTAENGLRSAVDLIRAGGLGAVKEVHVWTNRPIWPQSPGLKARPEGKPAPEYVHWDLFLGPAPEKPYSAAIHPFKWRGYWDYGTGALGDMGCHTANLPFMALKLGSPTSVEAEHEELNPDTYPGWAHVLFDFPARGELAPVKFHWYEGRKDGKLLRPPEEHINVVMGDAKPTKDKNGKEQPPKLSDSGCIVVGEKGLLYSPSDYGANWDLFPKMNKEVPQVLARNGKGDEGMKIEWLAGARGGPAPFSNFDYAGALTEFILLGNVAMRAGKKIDFDGEALKITNDPSLNKLLTKEYRKGFELPTV